MPQVKRRAAGAEPTGLVLAGDVPPGHAADDPLDLPLSRRVHAVLDQTGRLSSGDWKRAAWATRAENAANQDFSLTRLPRTGAVQAEFSRWVEAALGGEQAARVIEIRREEELLGRGDEFERSQSAVVGQAEPPGTERVQLLRSDAAAPSQAAARERRLKKTEAAVHALTPPPGPGRTQFTTGWELERAVNTLLAEQDAQGLLTVSGERQETSRTHHVGPGPGGPNRPQTTQRSVRSQITSVRRDDAAIEHLGARRGWPAQGTNAPASRLSLGDSVLGSRAGGWVERAFHQLKDPPLGIRPLFVPRDDPVGGLPHLLTLALRVLTLFEVLVRREQDPSGEELKRLDPGQEKWTRDRPTAKRVLEALARRGMTLTQVESGEGCHWHLTALPVLVKRVLGYLGLSDGVYTRLVIKSG